METDSTPRPRCPTTTTTATDSVASAKVAARDARAAGGGAETLADLTRQPLPEPRDGAGTRSAQTLPAAGAVRIRNRPSPCMLAAHEVDASLAAPRRSFASSPRDTVATPVAGTLTRTAS